MDVVKQKKAVMIPVEMVETISWSEESGLKLKEIREGQGLSRNKLVNKIRDAGRDISPQHIQKLETGFKAITAENQTAKSVGTATLQAILDALDYPLDRFLTEIGHK
ncbi:MAG: XRE family transcriptional regulator [Microcystis aeruginosa Ma_QC_B_20070730_S2]|uniref:XRE family transcriptional regulator n=1 Tax=Microcystis aeruginosa Ma_QC_B_20070730_S2 TaxID=2486256 RepID=A0A552DNL5_MICAE|nr:MAG: XRE family transcriptional regulator [Microcystis aeruginosa Ma_QC_B_20070730_S2]